MRRSDIRIESGNRNAGPSSRFGDLSWRYDVVAGVIPEEEVRVVLGQSTVRTMTRLGNDNTPPFSPSSWVGIVYELEFWACCWRF